MVQESSTQLAMGAAFGIVPPKQQVHLFLIVIYFFVMLIYFCLWSTSCCEVN